jgi:hypothetical protein
MIVIAVVPVPVVIPAMIVVNVAVISVPVTRKELLPIVMRFYPASSLVRRPTPIALMPLVMSS